MGALGPPMGDCLRHRGLTGADVCCAVLIVAVLTLAFLPILRSLDKFPVQPRGNDWFKECAFNRSAREAILRDRQFPLRTQYLGGGYPLVAYPEDSSLNPLFVTTLLFGENAGLKLRVFIKLLVGALGMYYLLRAGLGCVPGGAAIGSLFFGLADWFHARTGYGYIGWHNYYFLPLMIALLLDATRGKRSVALPSLVFALMLIDGKFVIAVSTLFLCLWGVPEVVKLRRSVCPDRRAIVFRFAFVKKLAMVVVLGCLLSMVKLLPMVALLRANPRGVSYQQIWRSWTEQDVVFYNLPGLLAALVIPSPPEQCHIGLGWIPVALALLAGVVHWRVLGRWLVLLLLFAWLCMGYWAPLDLFYLLWHLPVFGSMNKPAFCMDFFVLMPLCVLAGSMFRGVPRARAARYAYGAYLCAGAVGVAILWQQAYRANASVFTEPLAVEVESNPFFQAEGNGKYNTYHNMVQNIGSIDWDGDILLPEHAVPAFFVDEAAVPHRNEAYQGEIWFARGQGSARLTRLSANAIDVEIECTSPPTIVINQNFDPRWRSSPGRVVSRDGLLAITNLPVGGKHEVRLRYSSWLFLLGLAVSTLTGAVLVWRALIGCRARSRDVCAADTERGCT